MTKAVVPEQAALTETRQARKSMRALLGLGQSVWLDYLRRDMTRSGELARMVADGLRGMTSNQTIFEQAIAGSADYDDALIEIAMSHATDREAFEALAVQDVQEAADVFRQVYDETDGADGFVSIEVSPALARDTDGSIAEARRLWQAVDRPNVMIKIPGTREGWPAIQRCLEEGININITLLFSLDHYQAVADAYLRALEARAAKGQPIDRIASAASLFVSRVDTEVDKRIDAKEGSLTALRGRVAIANARLVYAAFVDVLYVESLIGPATITTVPPETLRLFQDHGVIELSLPGDVSGAHQTMSVLAAGGVDFDDVNRVLEEEGIAKFTKSLDRLLSVIEDKRKILTRNARAGTTSAADGASRALLQPSNSHVIRSSRNAWTNRIQ